MQIARIPNATRVLGKSQGYLGLPVRDEQINTTVDGPATPCMTTAWTPMPDELARIAAGAAIHVRLVGKDIVWEDGKSHPPIMVEVGEVPE